VDIKSGTNDFGPFLDGRYSGGIRVVFQGKAKVSSVTTTGRGDRTSRNVGVGSREATVRSRVKGITCETFGSFRTCHTRTLDPGQRVTEFRISKGRVKSVVVARVID
jgi:hypothetical protein